MQSQNIQKSPFEPQDKRGSQNALLGLAHGLMKELENVGDGGFCFRSAPNQFHKVGDLIQAGNGSADLIGDGLQFHFFERVEIGRAASLVGNFGIKEPIQLSRKC